MILKIVCTDNTVHILQCDQVIHWPDQHKEPPLDCVSLIDAATPWDGSMVEGTTIQVRKGETLKNYFTNCITYLMNDDGKTIDRL